MALVVTEIEMMKIMGNVWVDLVVAVVVLLIEEVSPTQH